MGRGEWEGFRECLLYDSHIERGVPAGKHFFCTLYRIGFYVDIIEIDID